MPSLPAWNKIIHPMNMDRDSLMIGACHALAHAANMLEDAAILFAAKRISSSFLLAVAAREELGRFNILCRAAEEILGGATMTVGDVQNRMRPRDEPHQAKLKAGQSTFLTKGPWPPPVESYVERQKRYDKMRKADSKVLHTDRLAAQYVDLKPDGTWSVPSATNVQSAHQLIFVVAGEIGSALQWSETDHDMQNWLVISGETLPNSNNFWARFFSLPSA